MKHLARFGLPWPIVALLFAACAPEAPPNASTAAAPRLTACPSTNVISDPEDFQWTYHPASANNPAPYYSGTMEVGLATLIIDGQTLTTRAYRQQGGSYSIPGPTIRMTPGNKYVLRFHNTLPYEAPSAEHNAFKDPNISNLHTHGLHISGESPGDDVTRSFEGGFGGDFVYDIPADHMGGTFWYHAHHHGSTYLQVAGGMFGLLIIDDGNDGLPAEVAGMQERQLLVAFLDTNAAGTGGDTLMGGSLAPTWTVNGRVQGSFCLPANEWQRWRVLLADPDAKMKTLAVGSNCEVALLARDGVWRTVAPKILTNNDIELTGASRADLAVRCTDDSQLTVNGNVVAKVQVDGAGDTSVGPYGPGGTTWSAVRPSYLRDLRNETGTNNETVNMGARTINGSKFDPSSPTFTLNANQVQEWNIKGATNHPFHLHVYHIQAQNCSGDFEDGEYYDTVASACKVRFDLNATTSSVYSGKTIMHCHILEHEDQGAMGWLQVQGGGAPPTYPADLDASPPYSVYYAIGGGSTAPAAPSGLTATAVASSQIDLAWTDNANNEDGFTIERSGDGSSWTSLDSVGANVTTYSDTGLPAANTYYYRVIAFNAVGSSSPSNTDPATTLSGGSPASVTVGSITVSAVSLGKGNKRGRAVVVVHDDLGGVVQGAIVTGDFSGDINEVGLSGPATDASGSTAIETTGTAKGGLLLTFCVTSITHPTLQSFSANPGEVCASN